MSGGSGPKSCRQRPGRAKENIFAMVEVCKTYGKY